MTSRPVTEWTRADYEQAARAYEASLPLEHYMEGTAHAKQREVTVESFAVLRTRRHDVHILNELLIQYLINSHLGQVVPDNAVALSDEPLEPMGSFNVPFETAALFWMLEYVSPSNTRKDYRENYRKYEQELRVPYYLIFNPENKDLRLYRLAGSRYQAVTPNAAGRLAVPELTMEVGLIDGWARFWYEGELLPLPEELQAELDAMREQLAEAREQAVEEHRRAEEARRRADEAEDREQEQRRQAEEAQRLADEQRRQAEEARRWAAEAQRLAEEARRRAAEAENRAREQERLREEERQRRVAMEAELAQLRALLNRPPSEPPTAPNAAP
jgi:Uma2 family endonuclease